MNGIVGQRIVRKVCAYCKETYPPLRQIVDEMRDVLGKLFPPENAEIRLSKGGGCEKCAGSGYLGRIGIFEVLPVSNKISNLILEHPNSSAVEKEAVLEGMITMKQDGYLKVLQGITTPEEVIRVAQE